MAPKKSAVAPVQAAGSQFDAAVEQGRKQLLATLDPKDICVLTNATGGERYEGEVSTATGKRHGKGMLKWANGNVFLGSWVDGTMCGEGRFFYAAEGDKYEGGFRDDKKHGRGCYTFANGNSYTGEFAMDKRHGRGKYAWVCGDAYEGEWSEGRMHGFGTTLYANGNKYVGQFVEDRREGKGNLTCTDGLAYDGEWLQNNRHGIGRLDFPSGDFYFGDWRGDKKHGRGKDTFANGNSYDGEYANNAKHGQGVMKYSNGDAYEGAWAHDKMDGKGVYTFANGFVYNGEWKADARHGFGEYLFPNGHVYRGHWANDRRHGSGVLTLSSNAADGANAGETYEGTWVDGKMQGRFRVLGASGTLIYEGEWQDGAPSGTGTYIRPCDAIPGAFLTLDGTWTSQPGQKRGMGTVDPIPMPLLSLVDMVTAQRVAAAGDLSAGLKSTAYASSMPKIPVPPLPDTLFHLRLNRTAAALNATNRGLADAVDSVVAKAAKRCRTARDDLSHELEALRSKMKEREALIKKYGTDFLSTIEANVARASDAAAELDLALTKSNAEAEAFAKERADIEAELTRMSSELDEAKRRNTAAKAKAQAAEASKKEAAAAQQRLHQAQTRVDDAERECSALETEVSAYAESVVKPLEVQVAENDRLAAEQKTKITAIEAATVALQGELKTVSAEHKAYLKASALQRADMIANIDDCKKATERLLNDAANAQADLASLKAKQEEARHARGEAFNALKVRLDELQTEIQALRGDVADVDAERMTIQTEVSRKEMSIDASKRATEKLSLQLTLFAEDQARLDAESASLDRRLQEATQCSAELAAAVANRDKTSRLRAELDKELLREETALRDAELAHEAERNRSAELQRALAEADVAAKQASGAGAAGRLRRLKTGSEADLLQRTASTVETTVDGDDMNAGTEIAALREEVANLQRKEAKKQEKIAKMHAEAREAAAQWMPLDLAKEDTTVLAAASKEAVLHQVIKLRSQYERIIKSRDDAQLELERLQAGDASSDVLDDADDAVEAMYIKEIIASIKAEEKDWRLNYLVEQLENRKAQIVELAAQAQYAKQLEARVASVNSAISDMKHQPRSAGMKPANTDMAKVRPHYL